MTPLVLVVTALILAAYDIVIVILKGGDATISWTIYAWSQKYPVIALVLGFIVGHIIWVQDCQCVR